jgi:hypothetical protein
MPTGVAVARDRYHAMDNTRLTEIAS